MTKFTATFSNGVTVTRTSAHNYLYAIGFINRTNGKVTATFTESADPKPNWSIFGSVPRNYGSANDRARWLAQAEQERAKYAVEIVPAVAS